MKIASVRRKLQSTELSVQIEHMERVNRTHTHTVTHKYTHTVIHIQVLTQLHIQSHSATAVGRTRTLITSDYTFINRLQASLLALDLPPPFSPLSIPSRGAPRCQANCIGIRFHAFSQQFSRRRRRSSARLDWACDWKSIWSCPLDWKAANYLK